MKEQELNQEPLPAAEPKTAVEAPENPKNPLNDNENENVYVNEKENDYVKDDDYVYVYENGDEKEKDYVKDNDNGGGGFVDSLILNDFDDEEYSSFGIGSMSNYIEGKLLEEQERLYRQSQLLEDERDTFV